MKFLKAAIDLLLRRKAAYLRTFAGPEGRAVLEDLMRFCRGNVTTFHHDARVHARLEGRKDVWLRIQNNLHLSPEQLAVIYQAATFEEKKDE